MFKAKTFYDFLPQEECKYLINASISSNAWGSGGGDFWSNRVINYTELRQFDSRASDIMLKANIKCKQAIKEAYDLNKEVYSDTLQVIRWFEGMSQPPHADDMSNTEIVGFDHRVFGSIIYLNADYSGGHTYYPNFNIEVKPEVGKLAIHPGDTEHLHGVTTIDGGVRYTIASFWTYDKEKAFDWSVYK